MENIYKLKERYAKLSQAYDDLRYELDLTYDENGGEVTEETEQMEKAGAEMEDLRKQILQDVIDMPDEYAAIVKNEEAHKKIFEAELKALKEEQAKACDKIQAKIKRCENKIGWFKENIAEALKVAQIEKIGGAKTDNKFTIYFTNTSSVEVDEPTILHPYQKKIQDLIDSLPKWLVVTTSVNKSVLKKEDVLPEGAAINSTKNLQIK